MSKFWEVQRRVHVAVAHVKTYLRRVYFVSTSVSIIGVQIKVFISWFTATIFIIPMLLLICQYKTPSLVVTGHWTSVFVCWWMIFTSYLWAVNGGVRSSSGWSCSGPGASSAVIGCPLHCYTQYCPPIGWRIHCTLSQLPPPQLSLNFPLSCCIAPLSSVLQTVIC